MSGCEEATQRRIVLMPADYLPNIGGHEIVVRRLADSLTSNGWSVRIVTPMKSPRLRIREIMDDVEVLRLPMQLPVGLRRPMAASVGRLVGKCVLLPACFVWNWAVLSHLARLFRPQIVHAHYVGPNALYAALLARLSGAKLVLSIHGDDVLREARLPLWGRWLFRTAIRSSDALLSNSNDLLVAARKLDIEEPETVTVVWNDVDTATFRSAVGRPREYLLGIGRFVHRKGFDVLVRAFSRLPESCSHAPLVLAGDGPELRRCRALAEDLDIAERVQFLGEVPYEDVPGLMAGARLVAVPSRDEPFGLVVIEAMAAESPVVAATVGGIPEIVQNEENGLLVPRDDPDALAWAMGRILSDHDLARSLAARGLATVKERFSREAVMERYLAVYEGLLRDPPRGGAVRSTASTMEGS